MNNEKKPWRWGKRKEERNSNRFLERNDEDRRKRALVSLLSSSLPLPLHSFVSTAKGVVAQVGGDGFRVGRRRGSTVSLYCIMGPSPIKLKKSLASNSKHGMQIVKRKVLDDLYTTTVSVCPFEQWIKTFNFRYQFYIFSCRKRILPFIHLGCHILPSLEEFVSEFSITNARVGKEPWHKNN